MRSLYICVLRTSTRTPFRLVTFSTESSYFWGSLSEGKGARERRESAWSGETQSDETGKVDAHRTRDKISGCLWPPVVKSALVSPPVKNADFRLWGLSRNVSVRLWKETDGEVWILIAFVTQIHGQGLQLVSPGYCTYFWPVLVGTNRDLFIPVFRIRTGDVHSSQMLLFHLWRSLMVSGATVKRKVLEK